MNREYAIAYLAPEIPALSATFVYNEILRMERNGFRIVPISVHVPESPAEENGVEDLARRTIHLYGTSFFKMARSNAACFFQSPATYLGTFATAARDALLVGLKTRAGQGLLYRFFAASNLARILKTTGARRIHAHFAHIPTDIAMYASRLCRIPFSFTAHANDLFERGWLIREKVARADFAVAISEYNRDFMVGQGADRKKIHIVRCGVDSGEISSGLAEKAENAVPAIGSLGRLVEKKGMDVLIAALGRLKADGLEFRLEIAGDGPLTEELKRLSANAGIAERTSFLGAIRHDDVFKWLRTLDLFALACKEDRSGDRDGIPVVLMESMAAGIPTISTGISGIPELIEDGRTGLLAAPGDPESLADKIAFVLRNPAEASAMAANAEKRINEEFDTDANARRLGGLFDKHDFRKRGIQ